MQALGPLPLHGAVISQFLAGYHTGQLNTAGRPTLAVGPRLTPDTSETLPMVGEEHRRECLSYLSEALLPSCQDKCANGL